MSPVAGFWRPGSGSASRGAQYSGPLSNPHKSRVPLEKQGPELTLSNSATLEAGAVVWLVGREQSLRGGLAQRRYGGAKGPYTTADTRLAGEVPGG